MVANGASPLATTIAHKAFASGAHIAVFAAGADARLTASSISRRGTLALGFSYSPVRCEHWCGLLRRSPGTVLFELLSALFTADIKDRHMRHLPNPSCADSDDACPFQLAGLAGLAMSVPV